MFYSNGFKSGTWRTIATVTGISVYKLTFMLDTDITVGKLTFVENTEKPITKTLSVL